MKIDLTQTEIYLIEQLINQEIKFVEEEPEHNEEIKAQLKPYKKLLNKLNKIEVKL